jgi:hypothetical protein
MLFTPVQICCFAIALSMPVLCGIGSGLTPNWRLVQLSIAQVQHHRISIIASYLFGLSNYLPSLVRIHTHFHPFTSHSLSSSSSHRTEIISKVVVVGTLRHTALFFAPSSSSPEKLEQR